jgi:hypothetical protein
MAHEVELNAIPPQSALLGYIADGQISAGLLTFVRSYFDTVVSVARETTHLLVEFQSVKNSSMHLR